MIDVIVFLVVSAIIAFFLAFPIVFLIEIMTHWS